MNSNHDKNHVSTVHNQPNIKNKKKSSKKKPMEQMHIA